MIGDSDVDDGFKNNRPSSGMFKERSTSVSTISRKEFKSVEVQTEDDKSAGISGTEFRSVEVQTEEVSSSLEDDNTFSIINDKGKFIFYKKIQYSDDDIIIIIVI